MSTNEQKKEKVNFLGFFLKECNYKRDFESGTVEAIKIIADDCNLKENNVFDMNVKIELLFKNNNTCKFCYLTQFRINDLEWFNKANEQYQNLGISNLFSLSFPYIRASISCITSDNLGQILIPIINSAGGDITKGLILTKNN